MADYQDILEGVLVMIETSGVNSDEPRPISKPSRFQLLEELVDDIRGYVEKALAE